MSVAPSLTGPWWSRFLRAQLVVDETWALSADGRGGHDPKLIVGARPRPLRARGSSGRPRASLFGDLIGDPARLGLDAAFPALFLALLVPNLDRPQARTAALLGAAIALALTPIAPAGVPIIAAALACARRMEARVTARVVDGRDRWRGDDRDQGCGPGAPRRQAPAPEDRTDHRPPRARPPGGARRDQHVRRGTASSSSTNARSASGAAAVAVALKAPPLLVVVVAAVVTADRESRSSRR